VNRERVIAERRFNEVRQLSNKLFDIEKEVRRLSGGTKARQMIVETSLQYLARLASDAGGDPSIALDLATAYMRVGRVQGVPITSNLGQSDKAEQNHRIAERLIHSIVAGSSPNRLAFLRAAQIAHDRMVLAQARRPNTEALPLARESERWLQKYLAAGEVDLAEKDQIVIVGMNIANWYVRRDEMKDGLRLLQQTIDIARATNQREQAGAAQIVVSRALRTMGDLDGSLAAIRAGVTLLEPPPGEKKVRTRTYRLALITEGEVLGEDKTINLGRPQEAAKYFESGYKIALDLTRQDPNDSEGRAAVVSDGTRLAGVLRHTNARQAVAIYDETLQYAAQLKDNSKARRDEIRLLAGSTYPLRQLGRSDEARRRLDAAFSKLKELNLYPKDQVEAGSEADDALRALAELEAGNGHLEKGLSIYEQLLASIVVAKPKPESRLPDAVRLSSLYRAMADLQEKAGHITLSAELSSRDLELWRQWDRKLPHNDFVRRQIESSRLR
jgi:tetratricopeptide (TPR) repeat protein